MKVTNGDIYGAKPALQQLLGLKFPIQTSYKLARMAAQLNEYLGAIEAVRTQLVMQHGEAQESGQTSVIPGTPAYDAFMRAFNELMAVEVEFPGEPVMLPADATNIEVEPTALLAARMFIAIPE